MADYMTTYSKINFAPLEPRKEDILLEDIAHALAFMPRANGHFPEFYSVAQHCINCCKEALARNYSRKVALACLLHDASEAYIGDITRPLKKNLHRYLEIEEILQGVIYDKYIEDGFTEEEEAQISLVDDAMLYHEFVHYTDTELPLNKSELLSEPAFKFEDFIEVKNRFKELFFSLRG